MEPDEPVIQLPKSGLLVQDGFLLKRAKDGTIIGRHCLADLRDAGIRSAVDYIGVVFFVGFGALAVVAKLYLASAGWSWAGSIMLAVASLFCLAIARQPRIWIESACGRAEYAMQDDARDCEGFVLSVKGMLSGAQAGRPEGSVPAPAVDRHQG